MSSNPMNCVTLSKKLSGRIVSGFSGISLSRRIADESRRKLLDQLRTTNGQTLTQLCGHLDMTRQAVSKHLGLLEEANLVVTVKRSREKLHYLNPVPINEISMRWIGKFEEARLAALHNLKEALKENDDDEP